MSESLQEVQPPSLVRVLLGPWGWLAGVAWGFAEGTFFFLVPDLLISFVALYSWRASGRQVAAVIGGSLVAGALLFGFSSAGTDTVRSAVLRVPLVRAWMFDRVARDFEESGVWALCRGPASGIPYKVYAAEAPRHVAFVPFVFVSVPARLERLLLSWIFFAGVGGMLRKKCRLPPRWALAGFLVYWTVVYCIYSLRILATTP